MKKMILSAFALTVFTAASYAQDATSAAATNAGPAAQAQAQTEQAETKTQMDVNALPDGVKQTLAADQYKDWQLVTAWYIKGASEYYVLEMQKGEEKTTLKLNKDGKPA